VYLVLAAGLFGIGAFGLLTRRSALIMFMCIELMLNAVNLTFVTFSRTLNDISVSDRLLRDGVAAAEVTSVSASWWRSSVGARRPRRRAL